MTWNFRHEKACETVTKYTEMDLSSGSKFDVTIDESRDFKGSGGEKKIFIKGQKAYGIYHDPANSMPMEKCAELGTMTDQRIIRPVGLLFKSGKRVGEAMMAVQDPLVLCSLFTMTFRKQHNLTEQRIAVIAKAMNEIVSHAHSKSIYVVDNNENNWLLSSDFSKVFAIDTGNWQTPSFPATMIMLNIKDPFHSAGEKADWFAQAILLANLYIGKHPFEASHPNYEHIPKASVENGINRRPRMESMMRDRIAFFDPACSLNRACYPLDSIPGSLRRWMKETLMGDLRTEPPKDFETVACVQKITAISVSQKFDVKKLFTTVGDIFHVSRPGLKRVILTDSKWYIDQYAFSYPACNDIRSILPCVTNSDEPVLAFIEQGRLQLWHRDNPVSCAISARGLIVIDGRLIVINHNQAIEVSLIDHTTGVFVRMKTVGQIMDLPNATTVYPGCVIQNMLGSWRVSTFPIEGRCVSTRLTDLEGGSIMDAKYERGVLMVIGHKKGIYSRYLYFEDSENALRLVNTEANVTNDAMNWTVNGRQTMTMIQDDGRLLALRTSTMTPKSIEFDDPAITADMILSAEGNQTHFYRGNELYSLAVKP